MHAVTPVIFLCTVGLSLARPRIASVRIEPWVAALVGAVATLLTGVLSSDQVAGLAAFLWQPVLTLACLMVTTIVADRSGLFRLMAEWLAASSGGDARRLFTRLFFGGAVMGALVGNDATVLILTPLVVRLVREIEPPEGWSLRERLPFYFAVLYVANLVGALIVSNPIHMVVTRWWDIAFLDHAAWMFLPAVASALVSWAGLRLAFRRSLPRRYAPPPASRAVGAGVDRRFARACAIVLAVVLAGFFAEHATGLPMWSVASAGAIAMLALQAVYGDRGGVRAVGRDIGWDALAFMVGIFVVVNGLRAAGSTAGVGTLVADALAHGEAAGATATSFITAGASALMNNHPAADTMAIAVLDLGLPAPTTNLLVYATLIGGDLGPRMLPIGSLAALIWFRILRRHGVDVSFGTYIRLGVPITLVAVAASLIVLLAQAAVVGL